MSTRSIGIQNYFLSYTRVQEVLVLLVEVRLVEVQVVVEAHTLVVQEVGGGHGR
jgi:hypothetical protein